MRQAIWLTCVLWLIPLRADAAPKPELVKSQLLADVSAVKPGSPFTLGVWLHVAPGWHVYWLNPGDSGLPTSVHFKLPPGFTAGPIEFPVPQRIELPGHVVNYGYEDQVLLMAKVVPPADLKDGTELKFEADVRWLSCKDACLLGSAKPQLTLATASKTEPANQVVFGEWAAQVPATKPMDVRQSSVDLSADGRGKIVVRWNRQPKDVQLFPGASDALVVSDVSINTAGDTSTIAFNISRLAGMDLSQSRYPLVAGYTDTEGHRRGLAVDVPVAAIKVAPQK